MASTNGSFVQQDQYRNATESYPATSGATETSSGNGNGNGDLSKDEIGWYFVEQYYTTLSKFPEKLHLFYGKRSQFVTGPEAEVTPVSVGRSAIQERIKSLDFQDCKVRVSNVDSQSSDENIVIQVIGETSNNSTELKKFVQTFVLAQQPSGYFVLNDIFRYINDEAEEETEAVAGQLDASQPINHEHLVEGVEMPKTQPVTEDLSHGDLDTGVVDRKLEESIDNEPTVVKESPVTNGDRATDTEEEKAEESPDAAIKPDVEAPSSETVEKTPAEEDPAQEPEKPKEPSSSPTAAPITTPATTQPVVPAKPMSWANRAAAAAAASAPRPAVPNPKTASPVPSQTRAPPVVQPAQPVTSAQATQTTQSSTGTTSSKETDNNQQAQGSGWQTAGSDHSKRQNRPQSVSGPVEKEGTMGYVRNVTEVVKADDLRAALSSYGELVYFDINRLKNCAFVEFKNTEGYLAATAANPHQVNGESILVEPRRPKSSAYGGAGYNAGRPNVNGRGRGAFDPTRGGGQRGRGDFGQNRGRGAPRGRGTGQPTAA